MYVCMCIYIYIYIDTHTRTLHSDLRKIKPVQDLLTRSNQCVKLGTVCIIVLLTHCLKLLNHSQFTIVWITGPFTSKLINKVSEWGRILYILYCRY